MFPKIDSYSLEQLPRKSSLIFEDCKMEQERKVLTEKTCNQTCKAFLTLFYLTLQSILSQSIAVIVKILSYISISQLSLTRFAGIFVFVLPMVIIVDKQTFGGKNNWFLLFLRALLCATGLLLQMAAFRYLQLVEVSIIRCTHPFFTAIFARVLLKEHFGRVQSVTLPITICGVLLCLRIPEKLNGTTRTQFDISFLIGLMLSVGGVLCLALAAVATRRLKNIHFSILLLYMGFIGIIENAVLNAIAFPLVSVNCGWDQLLCILLGVFAVCSNSFITLAYQLEPAGLVIVQKTSLEVLLSSIFQILFFSVYPDVYVISGVCLVTASLSIIGVKNWVHSMPDTSKTKQKLKWILT